MTSTSSSRTSTRVHLWDGCGWSPVSIFQFLKGRNWQDVKSFYADLVKGSLSLSLLGLPSAEECTLGEESKERLEDYKEKLQLQESLPNTLTERQTYKIALSFFGPSFDGWASNQKLHTVEGVVIDALRKLVGDEKLMISCAGRTDKGVSACAQVISFYAWKALSLKQISKAINTSASEEIRAWFIERVPRSFHATFSTKWRRYIYLLPLTRDPQFTLPSENKELSKDFEINVEKVQALLRMLEGKRVDYYAFARDTPEGKNCECFIRKAQATKVSIPSSTTSTPQTSCLCFEVIADRFLRKMMRVLVSTAVRESLPEGSRYGGNDHEALIKLVETRERLRTAPPAPPEGLCLAGVGFEEL